MTTQTNTYAQFLLNRLQIERTEKQRLMKQLEYQKQDLLAAHTTNACVALVLFIIIYQWLQA